MADTGGWVAVGEAWERVFNAIAELGSEIATAYKHAYRTSAGEEKSKSPPSPSAGAAAQGDKTGAMGDTMKDFTGTVDRSLSAARSAFDTSMKKLADNEKSENITRDVEGALRVSLAQLGETFTSLADQIGSEKSDNEVDADDTAPPKTGADDPPA